MSTHIKQLYPSPENYQHTNEDTVPFRTAAAMLGAIAASVPDGMQNDVQITGWQSLRLVVPYTDTPAEVAAKRELIIGEAMAAGARDGLTKDQIADYAARLAAA